MAHRKDHEDSRLKVARYQVDRLTNGTAPDAETDDESDNAGQATMDQRSQYVEIAIQQAQRRGDFDNLPGAGKPLPSLRQPYDPNWWIRQKIEREKLTGLGPPALTLRAENAELDARLDGVASERVVREILTDFNRRIVEARRQLQGGPPVVTPTREVEEEVARWQERRTRRLREAQEARDREAAAFAAMSWRERRRAKRGR
jgi:hypothetical protein